VTQLLSKWQRGRGGTKRVEEREEMNTEKNELKLYMIFSL
jgi:hypothetical protein